MLIDFRCKGTKKNAHSQMNVHFFIKRWMNGDAPLAGDVGSAEVNVYTYILYTFGIGTISFERSCKGIEMVYCGVSSWAAEQL